MERVIQCPVCFDEDLCFECEKIDIESEGFDADWIC